MHTTVDETHKKKANDFKHQYDTLPKKQAKIKSLEKRLKSIDEKAKDEYTMDDIRSKSKLKSDINKLSHEIYDVENNISELEYYATIDDLLIKYYDLVEKYEVEDHKDDDTVTIPIVTSEVDNNDKKHNKSDPYDMDKLDRLNLLSHKGKTKKIKKQPKKRVQHTKNHTNGDIMSYLSANAEKSREEMLELNRATLLNEYCQLTDPNYVNIKGEHYSNIIKECISCGEEKILIQTEGCYVCNTCGEVEYVVIESERPSYKDPMPEKAGYPYVFYVENNIPLYISRLYIWIKG